MNPEIMELLQEGVTVITPTRHLARTIREHYTRLQMQNGARSWHSAEVLDIDSWYRCCRDTLLPHLPERPLLLNAAQEHNLWLRIVRQSAVARRLLHVSGAARQARESYRQCKAWRIPIFADDIYLNNDAFHFRQWVHDYERELSANGWIDSAGLPEHLMAALASGHMLADAGIAFYGFDHWPPVQQTLFDALRTTHPGVVQTTPADRNNRCRLFTAADFQHEIRTAARWARQCIEQAPDQRIGIIVPDPGRCRDEVESIFNRQFAAESFFKSSATHPPFTIAQGRPLAEYPLIDTAMRVLSLLRQEINLEHLGGLLLSPYLGGYEEESARRALLDARIRRQGEQIFETKRLLSLLGKWRTEYGGVRLCVQLQALLERIQQLPRQLDAGHWVVEFMNCLQLPGWPGDRALDSDEHQTLAAWKQALDTFLSLDRVLPAMDAPSALSRLAGILADTGFQPEAAGVPIHIMGPEGAAGEAFDRLWICGLDDQNWPPPAAPLAFVPITVQRQAGIPRATAATQLAYAAELLDGLVRSAADVVLSHAGADRDQVLRPSPLLASFTAEPWTPGPGVDDEDYYEQLTGIALTESFTDIQGPPLATGQIHSGGSSLFRDQAQCPFRAFARHRLGADSLESVDIGLNARERGALVHRVLQTIWNRLGSHAALRDTDAQQLREQIVEAVEAAIRELEKYQPATLSGRFRDLEARRLVKQAENWLHIELGRAPFTVVSTEASVQTVFSGLDLRLRLDRMDRLEDGRLVIIDYKTGRFSPADWEGERPADPQLPLYAVTADGDIAALVFAGITPGDMRFAGLERDEGLLPGNGVRLDLDWPGRVQGWRSALEQLGAEYLDGRAVVMPRDAQSCRYCDLHAFCRIDERTGDAIAGDEDEPDRS